MRFPFVTLAFLPALALSQVPVLETPVAPPDFQFRIYSTVFPVSVERNGVVSRQVNVTSGGMNILGDAANEPSLAVDPLNRSRMAIGWRQFDSINSSFRQSGYGWSTDGGLNWNASTLNPGVFGSDPVLVSDRNGLFYYLGLGFDSASQFQFYLYRQNPTETTWSSPLTALGGDKQWLAADTTAGSGRGILHSVWSAYASSYGSPTFTRSLDHGASLEDPEDVPGQPTFGTVAVDGIGRVFLGGIAPYGSGFVVARSSNAKYAAVTPTFDFVKPVSLNGNYISGAPINPAGLGGQVWTCADSTSRRFKNNVYMLATVKQNGSTDPADVMFARSEDGGLTWSAPVKVNRDNLGQVAYQWFGTLSVAPNGRLDCFWLDTKYDATPATPTTSTLVYSSSIDAGRTWTKQTQISPAFKHGIGYPQQQKMGDYMQSVSSNTGAGLAYAATFNGEEDIWYLFKSNRSAPPNLP
jgi:hypothetical protein